MQESGLTEIIPLTKYILTKASIWFFPILNSLLGALLGVAAGGW